MMTSRTRSTAPFSFKPRPKRSSAFFRRARNGPVGGAPVPPSIPVPGGKVYIRHPNGIETVGEVVEILPPERIVFTYGYASGNPIPPGASRVTIRLKPDAAGTRLRLHHEFAEAAVRDQHVQGWRFQLSLFANAVADESSPAPPRSSTPGSTRGPIRTRNRATTRSPASPRPPSLSATATARSTGIGDLSAHVAAAQRFMPGVRLERKGDIRHCQGAVLADWVVRAPDGREHMSGTNLFLLAPDCRFTAVTGFAR